jgi:hypothetical protein
MLNRSEYGTSSFRYHRRYELMADSRSRQPFTLTQAVGVFSARLSSARAIVYDAPMRSERCMSTISENPTVSRQYKNVTGRSSRVLFPYHLCQQTGST